VAYERVIKQKKREQCGYQVDEDNSNGCDEFRDGEEARLYPRLCAGQSRDARTTSAAYEDCARRDIR